MKKQAEAKRHYNLAMEIETFKDISMLSKVLMHKSVNECINTAIKNYIESNKELLNSFKAIQEKA